MNEKKRFYELDLARVIPMIGMPLVHIFEEFLMHGLARGDAWTHGQIFIYLCMFGPSVFMICLGMNLVFSSHSTPKELAKRGLQTIVFFYVLNVIRYVIPASIAVLCGDSESWKSALKSCLCSDILFFAGFAFLFFALVKKLGIKPLHTLLITIVMLTIDMLIPDPQVKSEYLGIALGKFIYVNGWSCFPVLPWMVFPTIGYCLGHIFVKFETEKERKDFWNNTGLACVIGFIAVSVCMKSYGLNPILIAASPANSYITDLANVVLDVLAAGIWYWFFYFLYDKLRNTKVISWASNFSKSIMIYYAIHWICVGWLEYMLLAIGLRDQHVFSFLHMFFFSNIVFAISYAATLWIQKKNKKR